MSLAHGANIILSDLSLHLDAANTKSYPGTGTAWNNLSGNTQGTLINGPTYNTNESLSFDGVDDYFTIDLSCDKFYYSINWWLYPLSIQNYNQALVFNDGWNNWVFHTAASGSVYIGTNTATRLSPTEIPNGTVQVNKWQNFTYTFNSGIGSFYKNGLLIASKSGMSISANTFTTLSSGTASSGALHGKLSNLSVYSNKVLSPTEIEKNFNAFRGRYGI